MCIQKVSRCVLVATVAWILGTGVLFAQGPQEIEQATASRQIATMLLGQGYYEAILDQTALLSSDYWVPVLTGLLKRPPTFTERDKLTSVTREALATVMPVSLFVDAYAAVYEKALTSSETIALLDFYRTPLGQRALAAQGAMMADGGKSAEEQFQLRAPQLAQVMQQKLSDAFSPNR